jgi:hypothetical protein
MQSIDTFIAIISPHFLKHLKKNSYVPWKHFPTNKSEGEKFLTHLYNQIIKGQYSPSFPRDYVVSNKHNSVARIVPSLTLEDYCTYYYCVKTLEKYLALNRVEGTYGGFRLGGEFRSKEDEEFKELQEITFSTSPFTYNPLAWNKAWKDFQKKAAIYSADSRFSFFLKFDIANFYNTINLTILEKKVRFVCPKEYTDELDLLFFFLKYWNKRFLKYAEQTISIPQDEVGDCSRLLANFYLQDYDQEIYKIAVKKKCQYMRYSDDQIIMATDKNIAEDILFFASKELFKLGLNINSAKVERFDRTDWEYYWLFKLFNLLGNPNDITKIEKSIDILITLNKTKCRYDSVLKRILNCKVENVSLARKIAFLSLVVQDDFIINCDSRLIVRIYKLLGTREKGKFLKELNRLLNVARFNSFHYNLLRAKKQGLPITYSREVKQKIETLKL